MHESILRAYFAKETNIATLRADLSNSVIITGPHSSSQHIEDMTSEFELRPEHLIRLCDAVLSGELEPDALQTIGFCLLSSDHFRWDENIPSGDVIAKTIHDWSAPEINYRLTCNTVQKFRVRLLTGKNLFTDNDLFTNDEAI